MADSGKEIVPTTGVTPKAPAKRTKTPIGSDPVNTGGSPEQHEKPDASSFGKEFGVELNLPFATPFRSTTDASSLRNADEELVEILHDESEAQGPTVRQLIAMRRMDGQARALYRLLTLPIRAALTKATFIPAEDGDEEAEFIEAALTTPPESGGMTVTWHHFMSQVLQGLFDGFCAFEKVFWSPEYGPLQGKITLKKLAHRPSETVTFIADKSGGFAGLRQRAQGTRGKTVDVYIPPEYAFYYASQEEERKFYGVSFFQSAFYHYDKKIKLYYIAHLAAQRAAVGTRVGTYPATAPESMKREFGAALSNLSMAQFMMVPDTYKVELLKEGGGFDFLAFVNHHNNQMSKSILAAFFDENQGAGQSEGSLVNFAKPGDDMFILMLRAVMDDIAAQINHYIIPQLIDFNFDGGKYPKFTWGKLTEEQKEAIASTFDKIAASAQNLTPEFIRAIEEHMAEEYGLEIDYDEVDMREAEQADQQAQMQQAQMEGGTPGVDPVEGLGAALSGPPPAAPGDPAAPPPPGGTPGGTPNNNAPSGDDGKPQAPAPGGGFPPPAAPKATPSPAALGRDAPSGDVLNSDKVPPGDNGPARAANHLNGDATPPGDNAPAREAQPKPNPFDASNASRRKANTPPPPPPAPPAPANDAEQPYGLPKDWDLTDFENMLEQEMGQDPQVEQPDEPTQNRKNFERNLRLTNTDLAAGQELVMLAHDLLLAAAEEDR